MNFISTAPEFRDHILYISLLISIVCAFFLMKFFASYRRTSQ